GRVPLLFPEARRVRGLALVDVSRTPVVVRRLAVAFVEAPLLLRLHAVLLDPLAFPIVFAATLLLLLAHELRLQRKSLAVLDLLLLLGELALLLRDPPAFRITRGAPLRLLVPALLVSNPVVFVLLLAVLAGNSPLILD